MEFPRLRYPGHGANLHRAALVLGLAPQRADPLRRADVHARNIRACAHRNHHPYRIIDVEYRYHPLPRLTGLLRAVPRPRTIILPLFTPQKNNILVIHHGPYPEFITLGTQRPEFAVSMVLEKRPRIFHRASHTLLLHLRLGCCAVAFRSRV